QHAPERALPAAALAHEAHGLAGEHLEVHAIDGAELALVATEPAGFRGEILADALRAHDRLTTARDRQRALARARALDAGRRGHSLVRIADSLHVTSLWLGNSAIGDRPRARTAPARPSCTRRSPGGNDP